VGRSVIEKIKDCKKPIVKGRFQSIVFIDPIDLKDGEKGIKIAKKVPIKPKTITNEKPKIGSIFEMKM
jgi:hypothetical protein